jgi:hypothetical protein
MRVALLNLTAVPNEDMAAIALALELYAKDIAAPWERQPWEVVFYPGQQEAPVGWVPLVAFEQADQPGCEGYHDVDEQGRPYGRAFLSCVPNRTVLHDPAGKGASLSAVLAHELAEMMLDLKANQWFDGPFFDHATGHSYTQVAAELADPVQELSYRIDIEGQPIDVSDFIYPAWFDRRSIGEQYDRCRALTAPLTLAPGGYAIVRDAKAERQVFARLMGRITRRAPGIKKVFHGTPSAAWREQMKAMRGSRTSRRLAL